MSAPVKKCEVCDDTGSKSRDMGGYLDCFACDIADQRVKFREQMGKIGENVWGGATDALAWRAYQLGKAAAAPVVPVAAQPVVQQEPVAWLVYAEDHNDMVPQFPAYQVKLQADRYAAMYGQTPTEVRPLYTAPSLEAQPAGDVVIMPQLLTQGMKSVLKEVAPKWNAESIYANLYDAAAMAQGEKA